jgi:hypothetical protein
MSNISLKLPNQIVTLSVPNITATQQTNGGSEIRITEDAEIRVTEDDEVRIVEENTISSYPEVLALKLPGNVITVSLPSPHGGQSMDPTRRR